MIWLPIRILSEGGPADSNPVTDTDNDGIPDYYEVLNGYDPDVLADFVQDSINFTKHGGINDLDPFEEGSSKQLIHSRGESFRSTNYQFTLGVESFSSFVVFYNPGHPSYALPVESWPTSKEKQVITLLIYIGEHIVS